MTTAPIAHGDAHEIVAALYASLVGHHVTVHGDAYQVSRATVRRDSHGWPVAADLTLADDTRGDSIRVTAPVIAVPIRDEIICTVYGSDGGFYCGQPAGVTGRCDKHERGAA